MCITIFFFFQNHFGIEHEEHAVIKKQNQNPNGHHPLCGKTNGGKNENYQENAQEPGKFFLLSERFSGISGTDMGSLFSKGKPCPPVCDFLKE